jgi:josephin
MNPHRSVLGLGNYDINIIMKAIQNKGFEIIWHDKRRDLKMFTFDNIVGFILNIPNPSLKKDNNESPGFISNLFSFPYNLILPKRHWISIVMNPEDHMYYDLDSKLSSPMKIGDKSKLIEYLLTQVNEGCELFIVTPKSNASNDDQQETEQT